MIITQQLAYALYYSPKTILLHKKASLLMLLIYLVLGISIFSIVGTLLIHHQDSLKQLILDYLFPEAWQSISESLFNFMFESQARVVIANAILSGSLVAASVFLFPIKEKYSAIFEKEQGYPNGEPQEFSLWMQGWEETRLFLFYLTAQMLIVWIGYYPYQWANITSIVLSYLFLFYTFGLDLISPTFQRHRVRYSMINKLLSRHIVVTLSFGLLYSLPALLLSQWIMTLDNFNLLEVSIILFVINLFFIAIAIPAGTLIATRLLPTVKTTRPVASFSKTLGYGIGFILLIGGLILHTRLLQSMHHKSQVLKASYQINWDSVEFEYSNISELFNGQSFGKFSLDMTINNPTEFDIAFENSQIKVTKDEKLVSDITMKGFAVPAGQSRPITLSFNTISDFSQLNELPSLTQGWRIELYIELYPGIPFIVKLLGED